MTYKWQAFRQWLNKNDGLYFQVDNLRLNWFEVFGHLLTILSVMYYFFHEKVGIDKDWIGWALLIMGLVLSIYGALSKNSH